MDSQVTHTPSIKTEEDEVSAARTQSSQGTSLPKSSVISCSHQTGVSSFSGRSFSSGAACSGSFDINSTDSIGRMLIQLDQDNESLRDLYVDSIAMDKEAANEVALYLPGNTNLKKIRVRWGDRSRHRDIIRTVASGMKYNKSIECIEFEDAQITRATASWLVPSFLHNPSLKHVKMVNCCGSGIALVFDSIARNNEILQLTFHSCHWEDYNTDIMASSLPVIVNLRSIALVDMNLPNDGWPFLFHQLEHCRSLTHLNMSLNKMNPGIIYLLSKSMTTQKQISVLSLSSCCLDDECLKVLAKGLRNHSALANLDISHNNGISDKAVIYLKDMMFFNSTITRLKVDGCGLSAQSINVIQSRLKYNNSCLKLLLPVAVFDFAGYITALQTQGMEKNVSNKAIQLETSAKIVAAEERGPTESCTETWVDEERSLLTDEESILQDNSIQEKSVSIATEINTIRVGGYDSAMSGKGEFKRGAWRCKHVCFF